MATTLHEVIGEEEKRILAIKEIKKICQGRILYNSGLIKFFRAAYNAKQFEDIANLDEIKTIFLQLAPGYGVVVASETTFKSFENLHKGIDEFIRGCNADISNYFSILHIIASKEKTSQAIVDELSTLLFYCINKEDIFYKIAAQSMDKMALKPKEKTEVRTQLHTSQLFELQYLKLCKMNIEDLRSAVEILFIEKVVKFEAIQGNKQSIVINWKYLDKKLRQLRDEVNAASTNWEEYISKQVVTRIERENITYHVDQINAKYNVILRTLIEAQKKLSLPIEDTFNHVMYFREVFYNFYTQNRIILQEIHEFDSSIKQLSRAKDKKVPVQSLPKSTDEHALSAPPPSSGELSLPVTTVAAEMAIAAIAPKIDSVAQPPACTAGIQLKTEEQLKQKRAELLQACTAGIQLKTEEQLTAERIEWLHAWKQRCAAQRAQKKPGKEKVPGIPKSPQISAVVETEKQKIAFKLFNDLSRNNLVTLSQLFCMGLDGEDLAKKEIKIRYKEIENLFGSNPTQIYGQITAGGGSHKTLKIIDVYGFFDVFASNEGTPVAVPSATAVTTTGGMYKQHGVAHSGNTVSFVLIDMVRDIIVKAGILPEYLRAWLTKKDRALRFAK